MKTRTVGQGCKQVSKIQSRIDCNPIVRNFRVSSARLKGEHGTRKTCRLFTDGHTWYGTNQVK